MVGIRTDRDLGDRRGSGNKPPYTSVTSRKTPEAGRACLQQMVLENWTLTRKRLKKDPYLVSYTKTNSKWSKEVTVRHETIKLPKENLGESFLALVWAMVSWM